MEPTVGHADMSKSDHGAPFERSAQVPALSGLFEHVPGALLTQSLVLAPVEIIDPPLQGGAVQGHGTTLRRKGQPLVNLATSHEKQ